MQTLAHTKTFFQDLLSQEKEEKKKKITNIPNEIKNQN